MNTRRWDAAIVVPALLFGFVGWFMLRRMVVVSQLDQCPPGSFVSGSVGWPDFFVSWAIIIAMAALGVVIVTPIVWLLPFAGAKAAAIGWSDTLAQSVRSKLKLLGAVVTMGLPILVLTIYAGVCAWPGGFSERATSFSTPVVHAWSGVTRLAASCTQGSKGTIHTHLTLTTRDGAQIELPLDQPFIEIVSGLDQALRGVAFTYDDTGIADCRDVTRLLLAHVFGAG